MDDVTHKKDDVSVAFYDAIKEIQPWKYPNSDIFHHHVLPVATLSPWLNDQEFMDIYQEIKSNTLVDIYRCHELWTLARQAMKIEGDILEVGVWRGGTGAILAKAVKSRPDMTVILADTFEGVVKVGEKDTLYKGGEHADTSASIVAALLKSLSIENAKILKGIFPDAHRDEIPGKIAMLHCDVDVYLSSRDIVEWCLPRLSLGSILVFDDYGFFGCEGVTRFCDEFRENKDFCFVHNLNGHAIFIKIA
jgi:O-methyltransferase